MFQWGEHLQPWVIKLIKGSYGLKIAEDAQMVERNFRRWNIIDRLMLKTQDGTIGKPDEPNMLKNKESESDAVHVGDVTNHYHQPDPPPPKQEAASGGGWQNWILIALLLGILGVLSVQSIRGTQAKYSPPILEVERGQP